MALITKPDFTYVWASGGAVVAPNDTKKQLGWVAEAPPFQYDNWLQNRQDQMLAHINQRGMPAWDGLTNYEAGGLSYTQGSDGKIYKSVAASGPLTTVQDPVTDVGDTYWTEAFASIGAFLTQTAADTRYTQRSNNLSDLTNASTARTNLGVVAAVSAGIAGSYSNLKASSTGISAVVTITADSVCLKSASNEQVVLNSVSVTPSLAASGANGLDTGTSAINTIYYTWVIWNGTTVSGLLSLSSTSPAMPSGYTHKARVGSIISDSTGNKYPLSFKQDGNLVRYKVSTSSNVSSYPAAASGVAGSATVPTYVSVSLSSFIPATASAVIFVYNHLQADFNINAIVSTNSQTGALHSNTNPPEWSFTNSASGGTASYPVRIQLETLALFWANNNGNGKLRIIGWEDNL